MKRLVFAALILLLTVGTVQAAPIPINSSNGVTTWLALTNLDATRMAGATGTTVPVTPHPAWDPIPPEWISYAPTGYGDAVLAPGPNAPAPYGHGAQTPIVRFTRAFSGSAGDWLTMKLWADDTAQMSLDGSAYVPAHVFGQSTCETNPVSCQAPKFGEAAWQLTYTGTHYLNIETYQIGTGPDTSSNPFGIQYSGELVPEPASMLLLGGGLLGLAARARRGRRH